MSLLRRNFPGSALGSHHNRSVDTQTLKNVLYFPDVIFLVTINELGIWAQPLYKLLAQNLPGKGYYGALFQFNQREESWGRGSHKSRFWQESNSVVRDGWILIYFWHVYAFSSVHNFNHSTRSEGGSAANTNKCL